MCALSNKIAYLWHDMTGIPGWVENGQNENLKDLCQTALFNQLSSEDKDEYMLSKEKEEIYQRSIEYAAEVNLKKGLEIGREEGKAEGREEGKAEGILSVAKSMKDNGMSESDIIKCTGLSKEQVENL